MAALGAAFLAAHPDPTGVEGGPALDAMLQSVIRAARDAWPAVEVPPEAFVAHVAARLEAGDGPVDAAMRTLAVTDLYLACGCLHGVSAALTAFAETHLAAIPGYLARMNLSAAAVDDVRQEVAERLLVGRPPDPPRLSLYGGRGALSSWVAVAAQRTALSALRRFDPTGARGADTGLERLLTESADPELKLLKAETREKLEAALRAGLAALSPRERIVLRLTVRSGLSCHKIAAMYGVNASTTSRWLVAARESVMTHVRRALEAPGGDSGDVRALVEAACSQMELSLSAVLGDSR